MVDMVEVCRCGKPGHEANPGHVPLLGRQDQNNLTAKIDHVLSSDWWKVYSIAGSTTSNFKFIVLANIRQIIKQVNF